MTRQEKYDRLLDLLAETEQLESDIERKLHRVSELVATGAVGAPPTRHPYWVRAICLAFWLGAPAFTYATSGPVALLGYFVPLGGYCLLRDSWRILRGDL